MYGDSTDIDKGLAGQLPDAEVVVEPEVPAYTMKNCLGAEIGSVTSDGYLVVDRALLNTVIAGTYNGYTVSQVCTSNVTDMNYLFFPVSQGGTAPDGFNSDISNFDTSNVTNMNSMFRYAINFNQPVNFDTSNVTDMRSMFYQATSFNQPVNFDTSNVTGMNNMFRNASSFNQPVNFSNTSNITDMRYMFYQATSFNQPVNFDTSNVTYMSGMFYQATSFNQNISNWCVSKISREPSDFSTNSLLTTANKPKWGTCP